MGTVFDTGNSKSEGESAVTQGVEPPTGIDPGGEEHFKPTGTIFVLALFVATIILLWGSVYVILLSRGVTT
jgi:hypothetical protein